MAARTFNEATQIVVLGGSGDLARRKLLPALFHLFLSEQLPEQFQIIAFARSDRSDKDYKALVAESITTQAHEHDAMQVEQFLNHITYVSGAFDETTGYVKLADTLNSYEEATRAETHRLFYLAVPPRYYDSILENMHAAGIAAADSNRESWSRVLIEKPFGNDYKSAEALDMKLGSYFKEDQIFRIDHYLAKEAVQNILSFRFANPLFSPAWNKEYIKEVRIEMREQVDVGERGNFYKDVGALRDVGQNHLLQVLALITMDQPETFDAKTIQAERAQALKALRPYNPITCDGEVVRAQYEGFSEIAGIDRDSDTETYFELKTYIDNERWQDVPFYIMAGKALNDASVTVEIIFHELADGLFETATCETSPNSITLKLSPDQHMSVTLNAKRPGLTYQVEPRTLTVDCEFGDAEIKNSYEKVLRDCICGDQTLFASTAEVLASWEYIVSVLEQWHDVPLQSYQKGSFGPAQSLLFK